MIFVMEDFFSTLSQFVNFSDECKEDVRSVLQVRKYKKNEIIVSREEVCDKLWFISEGIARVFYSKGGKEITELILTEGYFVSSLQSFLTRQASTREVQVLEKSILYGLAYDDLEKLYEKHHEIERLGRLISNRGLLTMLQRSDLLMFSSASERYQSLLDNNPGILNRVPLGIIASYLGITQETLSRLRASNK